MVSIGGDRPPLRYLPTNRIMTSWDTSQIPNTAVTAETMSLIRPHLPSTPRLGVPPLGREGFAEGLTCPRQ